jgi:hypothetical protein
VLGEIVTEGGSVGESGAGGACADESQTDNSKTAIKTQSEKGLNVMACRMSTPRVSWGSSAVILRTVEEPERHFKTGLNSRRTHRADSTGDKTRKIKRADYEGKD